MLVQLYLCTTQCNTLKERHAGVPRLPNAFCCQAFFHEVWGGGPPCGGQREPKISGIHTLHMHGWYVYIHRKCVKAEEIRRVEENDQKQRRPRRPLVHALSVSWTSKWCGCYMNLRVALSCLAGVGNLMWANDGFTCPVYFIGLTHQIWEAISVQEPTAYLATKTVRCHLHVFDNNPWSVAYQGAVSRLHFRNDSDATYGLILGILLVWAL